MKTTILLSASLMLASLSAFAQSNEFAVQIGRTVGQGRSFEFTGLRGEVFEEDNGLAGGFVYNRKMIGGDVASLHLHLPFFFLEDQLPDESRFDLSGTDTSRLSAFITPGVQVRFLEPFFLQPYVFGGVGYARTAQVRPEEVSGSLPTSRLALEDNGTWGVSVGGGVDLMLGDHVGVRGEIRGLTAGGSDQVIPGLTLDEPSTRWSATGGLVFRF